MPRRDPLRIDLPAPVVLLNGNVVARDYTLILYVKQGYAKTTLDGIAFTPAHAYVEAKTYVGGVEAGKYTGANAVAGLSLECLIFEPTAIAFTNLTADTPVTLNLQFTSWLRGEVPV